MIIVQHDTEETWSEIGPEYVWVNLCGYAPSGAECFARWLPFHGYVGGGPVASGKGVYDSGGVSVRPTFVIGGRRGA